MVNEPESANERTLSDSIEQEMRKLVEASQKAPVQIVVHPNLHKPSHLNRNTRVASALARSPRLPPRIKFCIRLVYEVSVLGGQYLLYIVFLFLHAMGKTRELTFAQNECAKQIGKKNRAIKAQRNV